MSKVGEKVITDIPCCCCGKEGREVRVMSSFGKFWCRECWNDYVRKS